MAHLLSSPCTNQAGWKLQKCQKIETFFIGQVFSLSQLDHNSCLLFLKWTKTRKEMLYINCIYTVYTVYILYIYWTHRKEKLLLRLLDLWQENILYIDTGWWIGSLHLEQYRKVSNICKIMFDILGLLTNKKKRIYIYRVCGRKNAGHLEDV